MELIAGHVLFRHGDRTPIQSYPTDPMKEKDWPNGYGQLTIAGIEQHHRLGQYLRTRYGSILSSNYTASEIVVRSTDYDRTLMSAQSNLIGLYGLKNVSDDTIPIQPVPIHTVPMEKDFLLAVSDCPRYEEIENEVYQTDEFKKMNTYYESFFQKLQVWTNISNMTLLNSWGIADTIFIEHLYNKTPAWADDAVRKNLTDINELSFHYLYSDDDAKRLHGGPVIQDIWLNMNNSRHGNSYRKFKMYSAHDTTISAALAFLRINYPHQPQYASALFVDLYKQNSSYFVKVEYLNVTDSNKPYPYVLDGCSTTECPFEKFTDIYKPLFPGTFEVECMKKNPTPGGDGNNKKMIIILSVAGFALLLIIAGIFVVIYRRKADRGAPLLSSETYSQVA
ncbi:unnamed protein product [Adineta steineri]|uniref:acid phosphatase n=1 Tax=Adineta steineri TaxID=433720 RepID=A0A814ZQE6_9BILA|nr:unnamed protein product [Adineta steineri]CAF1542138.1 unnamed protein product [Adineta steineri]